MAVERIRKSRKSILLLGARQVGKSTLCRSLGPDKIINLADEAAFLSYAKDPSRLKREMAVLKKPALILVDEVQRLPSLLNSIQAILDEGEGFRFLLTGSSARKLKRGGANLLPGRVVLEHLDPCSFWELGDSFNLEKSLQMGSLPGIYLDPEEGEQTLSSYASIYLREEIQAEAISKNLGAYARFLDMAAEASGQWVNYSKIASDSEIPKETIRRFYSILEETLIAFRIPPFKVKQSKRRLSQRDRFIFFDLGVRNALLGIHRGPLSPLEKGRLFEQWFILQCLYLIRAKKEDWNLYSYRTDAGSEVDVVIDKGDKLVAVECKWSRQVGEADLKGLRSFESVAHKPIEKYVIYRGESRQKFSRGELAVPFNSFLKELSE
ncbi:MAG: ATP-binding protein [Elusimicrobia bacterium]|nr:ATP-binding protein [Elusimicrobiota bacterium]